MAKTIEPKYTEDSKREYLGLEKVEALLKMASDALYEVEHVTDGSEDESPLLKSQRVKLLNEIFAAEQTVWSMRGCLAVDAYWRAKDPEVLIKRREAKE